MSGPPTVTSSTRQPSGLWSRDRSLKPSGTAAFTAPFTASSFLYKTLSSASGDCFRNQGGRGGREGGEGGREGGEGVHAHQVCNPPDKSVTGQTSISSKNTFSELICRTKFYGNTHCYRFNTLTML